MEKKILICDTDVIIDYLDHQSKRHEPTKNILENVIGLEFITISAITKMELIAGVPHKAAIRKLTKNIDRFNILLINPKVNIIAVQLMETYRLSHGLAIADSLIAATAIYTGFEMFTYNVKDFKFITDLNLYNPVSE